MGKWTEHLIHDAVVGVEKGAPSAHTHTEAQISDLSHDALKIQGTDVDSAAPTDAQALLWSNANSFWVPGNVNAVELQGRSVASGAPAEGQVLGWTDATSSWLAANVDAVELRSRDVAADAPTNGHVLTWSDATSSWGPAAAASNATQLQGRDVAADAPASGKALGWSDATSSWGPATVSAVELQGRTLDSGAPADGQALLWTDSTSKWLPGAITHPSFVNTFAVKNLVDNIGLGFDNGGTVLTAGTWSQRVVDFACTIKRVTTLADTACSVEIDLRKTTAESMPLVAGDTIVASFPPTITNSVIGIDDTLTDWTVAVAAGDIIGAFLTSCDSGTHVNVTLKVERAQ